MKMITHKMEINVPASDNKKTITTKTKLDIQGKQTTGKLKWLKLVNAKQVYEEIPTKIYINSILLISDDARILGDLTPMNEIVDNDDEVQVTIELPPTFYDHTIKCRLYIEVD